MKVRVADLYRSGLHWEFIAAGVEDLPRSGEDTEVKLSTSSDLLAAAIKHNTEILKAEAEQGTLFLLRSRI